MEKKSIAALILAGAMVLGLTACGTNRNTSDSSENSSRDTDKSAVTESVDTSGKTDEVEQDEPDAAETTPVSQTEAEPEPVSQPQEETPVPEETGPKFTEVNETVYATTSVNVRSSYSADSDRVGGLSAGASATRTGVGDNGWSRIVYGDGVAYVNSDYLSTTKPSSTSNNSSSGSSTSSGSTSKPSTSSGSTNNGSTSGMPSNGSWLGRPLNPSQEQTGSSRPSEDDFSNVGTGHTGEDYEKALDIIREEMAGSIK